jgi:muconolactone delta-isomerase
MEYLVTMTTRVPDETPRQAVTDIRAREAARSRELAEQGRLLRLWRPPLDPGEWRTLGLFAARDGSELERALASMPLRVWRTDTVTPLAPHPDDPAVRPEAGAAGTEYLTTFTITIPDGIPAGAVASTEAREAERARELGQEGRLLRLWEVIAPAGRDALGLWRAADAGQMQAMLESLPLDPWMTVGTIPLSEHPSDPAISGDDR